MTAEDTTGTTKWLSGLYAPLTEELTAHELSVTGPPPAQLDARYLRNGPNPVGAVDPARFHWFTGDGMVHGVRLRDGKAEWYRNSWARNERIATELGEPDPGGPRTEGLA